MVAGSAQTSSLGGNQPGRIQHGHEVNRKDESRVLMHNSNRKSALQLILSLLRLSGYSTVLSTDFDELKPPS